MIKILLTLLMAASSSFAKNIKPTTASELKKTTVKITDEFGETGGTGVIFKSTKNSSYILTNSHVCEILRNGGGKAVTYEGTFKIEKYKQSKTHDLCMAVVVHDLKVNTTLAKDIPDFGDSVVISGHPYLLPTSITEGKYSEAVVVNILVRIEPCTEEDQQNPDLEMLCMFFGGIPVIKSYESVFTSAMIAPGNSGSAVFNKQGEIVGLAFAGTGRNYSHSFIVPLEHIKMFLIEYRKLPYKEANGEVLYSPKPYKSNKNKVNVRTSKLLNVFYPAIKSVEVEKFYLRIKQCKVGNKKCQKLLNLQ